MIAGDINFLKQLARVSTVSLYKIDSINLLISSQILEFWLFSGCFPRYPCVKRSLLVISLTTTTVME